MTIPSREELLALADEIKAEADNISPTQRTHPADIMIEWSQKLRCLAAKPADDGVRIPFDAKARLGFVWLIWGMNVERIELIAIATTEEARDRYLEAGRLMGRYKLVKDEKSFVDHLYGNGLLRALSTGGQKR